MNQRSELLSRRGVDARSQTKPLNGRALALGARVLLVALFALLGLSVTEDQASAQAWSLTKEQRQAYLYYYAPVILKRADESSTQAGLDWITNFDFDRDGNFSNNRVNWLNINQYVTAAANGSSTYAHWRIRPTLYAALIEYMEGGSKSLALIYHVYNAQDKDGSAIHDWESVEIVVRGITGRPGGSGEYVNHVTITHHKDDVMRRYYDSGLNFMQTATGRHVLLWQADESNIGASDFCDTYGHELRFVKNSYSWIAGQASSSYNDAEVNVSGRDKAKNINYVFVPEASQAAVNAWGAQPLSYATANSLASRIDGGDTLRWYQVKRITYELQDLADIIPTHWHYNSWQLHWLSTNSEDVLLESPIINEAGQPEVNAGLQRFYTKSRDPWLSGSTDGREGIPEKSWLYGTYSAELDEDCPSGSDDFKTKAYDGLGTDSYGLSRGAASGYYNSHGAYWWQHDFFVHSGAMVDAAAQEGGRWLTGAWYTPANGGFDGRWVQLFDDRPNHEPVAPLSVNIWGNDRPQPYTYETWSAVAANGTGPYSYTWYRDGYFVGTGATYSEEVYDTGFQLQVIVTDAAGATATKTLWVSPYYDTGTGCDPYSMEVCQPVQ